MTLKKNHPSVQQFKDFVKKHPKLIQEVRKGNKDWQEVFEDWYLLGENDMIWQQYKDEQPNETKEKDETSKADFMNQLFTAVKKMDMNTVNNHLTNMSSTISTLQGLFDQFGSKGSGQNSSTSSQHPFSFRKD
ncbi:YlbD family protein [Metabacillus halosaccharovorans]|uniref:YlbD family protein n=1 Tax=Metabacillus halosaccharovorans TaxID=930124 RepID=UPI002042560E|nr:YlbD family protein [Metabacillus halosaccharovorans]MCM3441226.1 YlbD family protein [Metabacillus halosaccharovorans]